MVVLQYSELRWRTADVSQCFRHIRGLGGEQKAEASSLAPNRILSELALHFGRPLEPGKTLLILDEIQEAPRALTSLKYFCEDLPSMHIAAAGPGGRPKPATRGHPKTSHWARSLSA